jgi:hypothetical protein
VAVVEEIDRETNRSGTAQQAATKEDDPLNNTKRLQGHFVLVRVI